MRTERCHDSAMATEPNPGECRLCGQTFDKRQMSRHLGSCWTKRIPKAPPKSSGQWFHLLVEGQYSPRYWLHLQASGKSTFGDLDGVLRRIWLECCSHLSEFRFPKPKVPRSQRNALDIFSARAAALAMMMDDQESAGDELMDSTLGSRLRPGVTFSHEYDFGSTTTLNLRVGSEFSQPAITGKIKVLARNAPPVVLCSVCKKPATQICTECCYSGDADLCDACAGEHKCGEDMLLPLVNSPRTGVCGYCGPSVEP
jgi:hypothetical protein